MGALDGLLDMVKQSVMKHSSDQKDTGFDPSALLGHIEQIFGQHRASSPPNVRPASDDPYGDPAGGSPRNVKPASQDPYGDPADERPRKR